MTRAVYDPGTAATLTCRTCDRTVVRTVQSARAAGWRIGPGVAYCPGCCGEGGVDPEGKPAGFDAECRTCGAAASDGDEDEDGPMTREEADRWKRYHDCESDVVIIEPDRPR